MSNLTTTSNGRSQLQEFDFACAKISAPPKQPIDDQGSKVLIKAISIANGEKMNADQIKLFRQACRKNRITNEEAWEAFWRAYGDPYVSGGVIGFRHINKHVQEYREQKQIQNRPCYQEL